MNDTAPGLYGDSSMDIQHLRKKQITARMGMLAVCLSAGLAIGGCASKGLTTGSINRSSSKPLSAMTMPELNDARAYWSRAYQKKPKDKVIGLNFANVLRMTGRNEQALAVMQRIAIAHPKDRQVLAAYGKALAGAGQLEKALKTIQRAYTPDNPDWRLLSAQGAILDQLGREKEARAHYRNALDLKPNEPSVLSNLGMSYLLKGDLRTSETYLRNAIQQPGADSRVRQNLALVVGLQGRFEEAERVAAGELPPAQARANIAYLRKILSEQNAWSQLKDKPKKAKKG